MNMRQAVAFAILMQGNQGIMTKHPTYLAEKLMACEVMKKPEKLLDDANKGLFQQWKDYYKIEWEEE